MKTHTKLSLGLLVPLCLLLSCARPPRQIIKIPQGSLESGSARDFTAIRIEGEFGVASGFFVDRDKIEHQHPCCRVSRGHLRKII